MIYYIENLILRRLVIVLVAPAVFTLVALLLGVEMILDTAAGAITAVRASLFNAWLCVSDFAADVRDCWSKR